MPTTDAPDERGNPAGTLTGTQPGIQAGNPPGIQPRPQPGSQPGPQPSQLPNPQPTTQPDSGRPAVSPQTLPHRPDASGQAPTAGGPEMQGEGNYEAGRRYDQAAEAFAHSGKVAGAAEAARPGSPEEAQSLRDAEVEGERHAKR